MNATRKDALVEVLRFYEALGFDRLPLSLPEATGGSPEDKAEALERLRHKIDNCTRCKLSTKRKNIVFGEGNPDADLMIIGEGPDNDEDSQGLPFVGEPGELLTRLINKMGLERHELYMSNIIKCHPGGNRDPEDNEIATCMPFIKAQINIIRPKVIITLGNLSSGCLLNTKTPINRLRGKFIEIPEFRGIYIMPTFHPSYLLKNRAEKTKVWADAMQVLKKLGRPMP